MYQLTSDSLTGTPITVTVGDRNPSTFFVHKSVISPACELFELILDECTDDSIHLDECEPAIFKVYLQWLYTSTIPMCTVSSKSPDTCKITVLGKAYLLGEYLMDGTFQGCYCRCYPNASYGIPLSPTHVLRLLQYGSSHVQEYARLRSDPDPAC